jgi:cytochrome b561
VTEVNNKPYSAMQIALHWLSAIVIIWALISGSSVALLDVSAATVALVSFINVSLTTLLIPFFLLRLLLALKAAGPLPVTTMERLAAWAHRALYGVTLVVLVTGVLMMDRPINVLDWLTIPAPLADTVLIGHFNRLHIWSCALLALLVAMHIAAVIKHQWLGRGVLARMWF